MTDPGVTGPQAQRIDKWLWHARFAPTRGAAQQLARSGHVRLNREKVREASRLVRAGDVLTLNLRRGVRVIRILGLAERRNSFELAQQLYEEATQPKGGMAGSAGTEPGEETVSRRRSRDEPPA
jgi:ribosome-associated heat shock protein Hsp15